MTKSKLREERLTGSIIGAFYDVYNNLGHGYLEHLHLAALEIELRARGHQVLRELSVRVMYKGHELGMQRLDMVVDDRVVVEAKSTTELARFASRQLYNYLRCTSFEVGLLLHFGPDPSFYRVTYSNLGEPQRKSRSSHASTLIRQPVTEGLVRPREDLPPTGDR